MATIALDVDSTVSMISHQHGQALSRRLQLQREIGLSQFTSGVWKLGSEEINFDTVNVGHEK